MGSTQTEKPGTKIPGFSYVSYVISALGAG